MHNDTFLFLKEHKEKAQKIIDIFLHPVSIAYMVFMNFKLLFQKKEKSQVRWKGRIYRYSAKFANELLK